MRSLAPFFFAVALVVCVTPLSAQEVVSPPAHISFVRGSVTVDHGDEAEPAVVNMPVVEGDRIITGPNGQAEVMFPDGGAIGIDPGSEVEFLSATRVRVIAGAIEHIAATRADPRSPSTPYLPRELQPYGGDLDQNGAWQYEPQYGNVWYPTTVTPDWRPYYDGYWYSAPVYGWTWIGDARWAWPTHHYGRWGYTRNRWFWIPGATYAGAWVSWGTAVDYVSWCPLGYDGRPVVGFSAWYSGGDRRGLYPDAWTIVRRDHFGSRGYSPRQYGVDRYRLAANTSFIEHRTPPSRARRGSFTVGAADRSSQGSGRASAASPAGSVGVAVPRVDSRNYDRGRSDQGADRRDRDYGDGIGRERQAPYARERAGGIDRSGGGAQPRVAAPVTPTPTLPSSRENDSPAYRPRYQPRYQGGAQEAPAYRDRRMDGGEARGVARPVERAQPIERAPVQERQAPAGGRPSAPPPAVGAPAPRESGAAPARERSSGAQSSGSAVRRPR